MRTFGGLSRDRFICVLLCFLLFAWLGSPSAGAKPYFNPEKTYRSISTDLYEVLMQKNGQVDIRSVLGPMFFDNASPMVVVEGQKKMKTLRVDARYQARTEVRDPLGEGQGVVFARDDFKWSIRAYPTKPFLTVQLSVTNKSRKPIRIAKLIPWTIGENRSGSVYFGPQAEQTRLLDNGHLFGFLSDFAGVSQGRCLSQWNLAAYNAVSNQIFVAGFLTNRRAYTQILLERSKKASAQEFDHFRAECIYDPPVELKPEETLDSELLYLAVAEDNRFTALDRYGKAIAVINGVRDERPFMPHGWDSCSTRYHREINEQVVLKELDFVDRNLKRFGWTHFAVGGGWERGLADWEPDPVKFPRGMKWLVDEIHLRGMTAGLWLDPFTIPRASALATAHPDWVAESRAMGRTLLGEDRCILDATRPAAREYVKALAAKVGQQWGFDALMDADSAYRLLLAERYSAPDTTRIEALRQGLQALRDGFGEDKFIMTTAPQVVNAAYAEGIRVGRDCQPLWRGKDLRQPWGAVDALTNAIRRYYFTPHYYIPDADCAYFGHASGRERWGLNEQPPLTWEQSLAWLSGQALLGGAVKIGEPFSELNEQEVAVLRKLLPSPQRPARPIDLFQEDAPRIWHLPFRSPAGDWHIVGVFNWDEATVRTITVPFAALGLKPGAFYTVYDFWHERYYGTAKDSVEVQPPQGGVCLLGLRPYEDHPMFLASDRHYTQGAMDHSAIEWDAQTRRLSGVFDATQDADYSLRILVPQSYAVKQVSVPNAAVETTVEGKVLKVSFHSIDGGKTDWSVQF